MFFRILSLIGCIHACSLSPANPSSPFGESSCDPHPVIGAIHNSLLEMPSLKTTVINPLALKNEVVSSPLLGGAQISQGLNDLVLQAKKEIMLEFFEVKANSWMTLQFRQALAQIDEKIPVYIIVSPALSPDLDIAINPKKYLQKEVDSLEAFFAPRKNVFIRAYDFGSAGNSLNLLHSKFAVIDGELALITDTNMQKNADPTYADENDKAIHQWLQLGFTMRGEIAKTLREDFLFNWKNTYNQKVIAPPPLARFDFADSTHNCSPTLTISKDPGTSYETYSTKGYFDFFDLAKEKIEIITPNFNDPQVIANLAKNSLTKKISIILSKGFNQILNGLWFMGGNNDSGMKDLDEQLKKMGNCHNVEVKWYADNNGEVNLGNDRYASHAKYAGIDNELMILGSQNMDLQSFKRSGELGIISADKRLVRDFHNIFNEAWARSNHFAYVDCEVM